MSDDFTVCEIFFKTNLKKFTLKNGFEGLLLSNARSRGTLTNTSKTTGNFRFLLEQRKIFLNTPSEIEGCWLLGLNNLENIILIFNETNEVKQNQSLWQHKGG